MKGTIKGGAIEQARVLTDRGHRTSMAHKVSNGANLTRHIKGGATTPIFVLNDNDIDTYGLVGGPAQPMIVQPSGRIKGGVARAVYPVDADGNYDYGFPRSDYMARVLSVERDSLIGFWPQDELTGTVSRDASPEGNDGVYTGVDLGQPGIGDGRTAPFFDGTNDFDNVYSAGLAADFSGVTGSMLIWHKVNAAAVWTDGVARYLLQFLVDANNYVLIFKSNANDFITYHYNAGGTLESALKGTSDADWMCLAMTWNAAGDMLAYFNGANTGSPAIAGVWVGVPAVNKSLIGAGTIVPANPAHGWLGPGALWNTELTPGQIAYLSTL